ncbi:GRASP55/65 PDZ-like domain-containing protein [Paraphysoderma sedebokerense]|nr:GRASP55/65 PDZ-like domain-containing protein [Paraphysoderma sedebokerense]
MEWMDSCRRTQRKPRKQVTDFNYHYPRSAQTAASKRILTPISVKETSPAHKAGLEPYFDFIVAVNDQRFPGESTILTDTIKGSINKDVKLTVFNSKNQSYRDVILVPYFWREPKDGLIGCSIRFCDYNGASEHVWHVVEVLKNSPAESAGLQPNSDYIVGCPDVLLYSQNDFFKLIQERAAQNQPVRMFVYSSTTDSIREILLLPNTNWGGEGLIGAQLGTYFTSVLDEALS